jgi:hypothetical protein
MDIVEYLALGPKAYALWLRDPKTGKNHFVKKCRGIILNYEADEALDYDRIREMVIDARYYAREDNYEAFEYRDKNFQLTRRGEIFSRPMVKNLRPTYFKGVLRGLQVVPFGYVHQDNINNCINL